MVKLRTLKKLNFSKKNYCFDYFKEREKKKRETNYRENVNSRTLIEPLRINGTVYRPNVIMLFVVL